MLFFVALVIGELTCNKKQLQQNLILLNQVAFVKTREGSITSSNPAEPVEIFIYRAQPVCPVSVLLAYLNLKGSSPGPMFYWADLSSISRKVFTKALAVSLRFCALDVSGYKSHSFRACGMRKLGPSGDGNQMPFSGTSQHLLYGLSPSCLPYAFNCYHSAKLLIKQGLREFVLWYLHKRINT